MRNIQYGGEQQQFRYAHSSFSKRTTAAALDVLLPARTTPRPAPRVTRNARMTPYLVVAVLLAALFAIALALLLARNSVRHRKKLLRLSRHPHRAAPTSPAEAAHKLVLSPLYAALRIHPAQPTLRKTLVLDLDETLVHSQLKRHTKADVRLDVDTTSVFYVSKRPYLHEFLRTTAQWFDIAIYTASQRKYANPLISTLDTDRVVQRRLFRDDCHYVNGNFVKDLTRIQPNLSDVLIVDNSPAAYQFNPNNALPIDAWYDDPDDDELLVLLPLLYSLSFLDDVRSVLQLRLSRGTLVARK